MLFDCKCSHWQQCFAFHHATQASRILEDSISGSEILRRHEAFVPYLLCRWWRNVLSKAGMTPQSSRRCFAPPGPDFVLQKIPLERSKAPTMCRVQPGVSEIFCLYIWLLCALCVCFPCIFPCIIQVIYVYITVSVNQSDWSKCSWDLWYLMFLKQAVNANQAAAFPRRWIQTIRHQVRYSMDVCLRQCKEQVALYFDTDCLCCFHQLSRITLSHPSVRAA